MISRRPGSTLMTVPRLPLATARLRSLRVGAEDAVAGGQFNAAVEPEPALSELALPVEERPGDAVQLGDVGASVRDHHARVEVGAGGVPPVGHEPCLRLGSIACDVEASV